MEFNTGAVRDDHGDKGRMDLMPLRATEKVLSLKLPECCETDLAKIFKLADDFVKTRNTDNLEIICFSLLWEIGHKFTAKVVGNHISNGLIDVSKHCQRGAEHYGEHNIDKGIPMSSLLDSGLRHLVKHLGGWDDEPHLVASAWNFMWLLEEALTSPELDNLYRAEKAEEYGFLSLEDDGK